MLVGSTSGPVQAEAEPVSKIGGTLMNVYLRKGRRHQRRSKKWEKKVRNNTGNTSMYKSNRR